MKRKMMFIYNPRAGKGAIKGRLSDVLELFSQADYEITVYPTKAKGDATEIIIKQGSQFDYVVCSGGDGTLNEVAKGLMLLPNRPPCGYIPAGTVNDFASSLGIPKDIIQAAKIVVSGKVLPLDIGSLNDEYFTYIAGFGAFTDVSYETSQTTKNIFGKLAYFLEGVKRLPSLKDYKVTLDVQGVQLVENVIFGMITNTKYIGGFKGFHEDEIDLSDGLFEATFVKMPKNPIELQIIINTLLTKEFNNDLVFSFCTPNITITFEEKVRWTIDGEFGGEFEEVNIKNHTKAISFCKEIERKKIDKKR